MGESSLAEGENVVHLLTVTKAYVARAKITKANLQLGNADYSISTRAK